MELRVPATLIFILQATKILAVPCPKTDDCLHSIVDFVSEILYTTPIFRSGAAETLSGAKLPVESELVTGPLEVSSILQLSNVGETARISLSDTTLELETSGEKGSLFQSLCSLNVSPSIFTVTPLSSEQIQILPGLSIQVSDTTGLVSTALQTSGVPANLLILNHIPSPTTLITTSAPISPSERRNYPTAMASENIFQPVATKPPPPAIGTRPDHPVPRLGVQPQTSALSTNKFYANFFLGSQTAGTWIHPYSVAWAKGGGSSRSWGISIMHVDANQVAYGPDASANPVNYFINPIGIQSLVLSAAELGPSTALTTDSLTDFSVNVNLLTTAAGGVPAISFPLVQGMGFVTGVYNGSIPILQTGICFRNITRSPTSPKDGVTKYTITLEDGKTWLLYAYSPDGAKLQLSIVNNELARATSKWNGIIQIAKSPSGVAESLLDAACGTYATTATLSGSVSGATGVYNISFSKAGLTDTTLAMFALPHHMQSFSAMTLASASTVQLQTTTKGMATAVVADSWTLVEPNMPTSMDFAPWCTTLGSRSEICPDTAAVILNVAVSEISQNMSEQTNLNSFYFSGKALAKFASIVYTISDILKKEALARVGLASLKDAFERFSTNTNQYPLVYESAWGGVVSSASYATGDPGADFGNTYYNDHNFHYGYFVYTAAVIGYLDPTWLDGHKDYVNTLVRDFANPSQIDQYFPVSRSFDWFNGHSWAHGLYETYDGKDEESSSEDSMSAYAIKMWGRTVGDANMEARGNLQLAITARSIQNYFLYTQDNTNQPAKFIGNKVSGILFENKIDHTTYFGANIEYIQGIHMLPLLPYSVLTRTPRFVREEWDTYFSNGRVDSVQGGWKGILYANLAIIDPVSSFNFFSSADFDPSWLDGGASRTWYLAFAAGLGGAP